MSLIKVFDLKLPVKAFTRHFSLLIKRFTWEPTIKITIIWKYITPIRIFHWLIRNLFIFQVFWGFPALTIIHVETVRSAIMAFVNAMNFPSLRNMLLGRNSASDVQVRFEIFKLKKTAKILRSLDNFSGRTAMLGKLLLWRGYVLRPKYLHQVQTKGEWGAFMSPWWSHYLCYSVSNRPVSCSDNRYRSLGHPALPDVL